MFKEFGSYLVRAMETSPFVFGLIGSLFALFAIMFLFGTLRSYHDRRKKEYQCFVMENNKGGESSIYRNTLSPHVLISSFLEHPEIRTMAHLLQFASEQFGKKNAFGKRKVNSDCSLGNFEFINYEEYYESSKNFAKGLVELNIEKGEKIGIYAPNSISWKIVEGACYLHSLVLVSLYASLGPNAVEYIINHADITTVVCSAENFDSLIIALENIKSQVKMIIILSEVSSDKASLLEKAKKMNIKILYYTQVLSHGKDSKANYKQPLPDDLCTLMYTSGTTGKPKGVMITHRNFIATIAGYSASFAGIVLDKIHLCYLPLAHMMERISQANVMYAGGSVGFFSGDIRKLIDDFVTLRPTQVVGAPRVYQKIYDNIMHSVETGNSLKKYLFKTAYAAKKRALSRGQTTPIWDLLVFNKIHKKVFGGRVEAIVSGSAPLSHKVHEFLRICFSCYVVEGYGMTETTAGACMQSIDDDLNGRVGPPLPFVEIKLKDVPEMKYFTNDKEPKGEICLRGPTITQGYYKESEKTNEIFDAGWLLTGDIGRLNKDGTISIIDRKKNLFKLNQGEYIAPEYLENVYCRSPLVAQCFVYGDSSQSDLVAVIVPEEERIRLLPAAKGHSQETFAAICQNPQIKKRILEDLTAVGKEAKLQGYEFIKEFHIESVPWTVENLLTPTFKLKRLDCREKYRNHIDGLYQKLSK